MTYKLQKYTILMKYERKIEEKTANSHKIAGKRAFVVRFSCF